MKLFVLILAFVSYSALSCFAQVPVSDGLQLHLDATQKDSLTLRGDVVTEWRDVSGNGNKFFPEEGYPNYVPDAANGLGAINLDGHSFFATFSSGALNLSNAVEGITAFAVAKNDAIELQCLLRIGRGYGGSASGLRFMLGRSSYQHRVVARRVDSSDFQTLNSGRGTVTPGIWTIDSAWVDFENREAALYINDLLTNSSQNFLDGGKTSATNSLMFRIGNDHINQYWFGEIAEILIYNRVLSEEEIRQIHRYLSEKYGIVLVN